MINIKPQFETRFLATGTLDKVERVEYADGTKELLKLTLKAGEDYFTYTIFNTKKEPQRVRGMMTKLRKGDFLKASGIVSNNEYEDKEGNIRKTQNYTAFYTEHIDEIGSPRVFITIAGILTKKVDKEDLGGKEITIRVFDDYREVNDLYTMSVDEKMGDFFEDVNEGDNISVTAEYINRAVAEIKTDNIKSYGASVEGIAPAGIARKFKNKVNVIQGYILAEESEIDEEETFFEIDNDDIPF
ncbi:hypothetical protein HKO22_03040 [Peptoniphilus sp. AGMB00490]|uniref:Uncharacterized protein n=1 Tax=Peptoniphilus faecalis TaxID=2731255 RepID=A0A848RD12_9FIRM|nr:hypothetical protein [Peptoniphilus faecalis]NMW84720.1 hypothetical protein [Peptoniphilus faecalis]